MKTLTLVALLAVTAPVHAQIPWTCRRNCESRPSNPGSTTSEPAPLDPTRDLYLQQVSASGTFYVLLADGTRLNGQAAANARLGTGVRLVCAASCSARITLPDGTMLSLGPESSFTLGAMIYEPGSNRWRITASLIYGSVRWTFGPDSGYDPTMNVPAGMAKMAGGDVEWTADAGGEGSVTVHAGAVELLDYDSAERIDVVQVGEKLSWDDQGKPIKTQTGSARDQLGAAQAAGQNATTQGPDTGKQTGGRVFDTPGAPAPVPLPVPVPREEPRQIPKALASQPRFQKLLADEERHNNAVRAAEKELADIRNQRQEPGANAATLAVDETKAKEKLFKAEYQAKIAKKEVDDAIRSYTVDFGDDIPKKPPTRKP